MTCLEQSSAAMFWPLPPPAPLGVFVPPGPPFGPVPLGPAPSPPPSSLPVHALSASRAAQPAVRPMLARSVDLLNANGGFPLEKTSPATFGSVVNRTPRDHI